MPLNAAAEGRSSGRAGAVAVAAREWRRWRARLALLLGRRDEAAAHFDALLARWPDDAHALASRAHGLAEAGRIDEAVATARRLVQPRPLRPDQAAGDWFNLGFVLDRAERLDEAAAAFDAALALDAKLDRAWFGLGLVRIRQGRDDDARRALARAAELQPMSPHAWYQLARLHARGGDDAAARRIIQRLRGFEPRVAEQLERETGLRAPRDA